MATDTKWADITSQVDGATRVFTTPTFLAGSLQVIYNGMHLNPACDFTENGTQDGFELTEPDLQTPFSGMNLWVQYEVDEGVVEAGCFATGVKPAFIP